MSENNELINEKGQTLISTMIPHDGTGYVLDEQPAEIQKSASDKAFEVIVSNLPEMVQAAFKTAEITPEGTDVEDVINLVKDDVSTLFACEQKPPARDEMQKGINHLVKEQYGAKPIASPGNERVVHLDPNGEAWGERQQNMDLVTSKGLSGSADATTPEASDKDAHPDEESAKDAAAREVRILKAYEEIDRQNDVRLQKRKEYVEAVKKLGFRLFKAITFVIACLIAVPTWIFAQIAVKYVAGVEWIAQKVFFPAKPKDIEPLGIGERFAIIAAADKAPAPAQK